MKTWLNSLYLAFGGNTFGVKKTIGSTDNQDFGIITNNTERVTILNNGNVGFGKTNPIGKMHFKSSSNSYGAGGIRFEQSDDATYWDIMPAYNALYLGHSGSTKYLFTDGGLNVGSGGPANTFIAYTGNSYFNTGNVGISTNTPKSKLQVNGGIQCGDDTAAASADKLGTRRRRTGVVGNVGFYVSEECAKTGVDTYAWCEVFRNEWIIP